MFSSFSINSTFNDVYIVLMLPKKYNVNKIIINRYLQKLVE